MLNRLFKRTETKPTDGLLQAEREAIIDLLHYAMYTDKRLSEAEDLFVDKYVENLAWESGTTPDIYVNQSLNKVRNELRTDEARDEYLAGLSTRFQSAHARAKALNLLQSLMQADGTTDAENSLLTAAKRVLR